MLFILFIGGLHLHKRAISGFSLPFFLMIHSSGGFSCQKTTALEPINPWPTHNLCSNAAPLRRSSPIHSQASNHDLLIRNTATVKSPLWPMSDFFLLFLWSCNDMPKAYLYQFNSVFARFDNVTSNLTAHLIQWNDLTGIRIGQGSISN